MLKEIIDPNHFMIVLVILCFYLFNFTNAPDWIMHFNKMQKKYKFARRYALIKPTGYSSSFFIYDKINKRFYGKMKDASDNKTVLSGFYITKDDHVGFRTIVSIDDIEDFIFNEKYNANSQPIGMKQIDILSGKETYV